jgi:hypothetical protein
MESAAVGILDSLSQHPWLMLLAALACSGVLMVSGRQDEEYGFIAGAIFWRFMALVFLTAFIVNAVRSKWWLQVALASLALAGEVWFLARGRMGHAQSE